MLRSRNSFILFLLGTLLIAGCKVRRVVYTSPLVPLGENIILDQIQRNAFDFNTLSGKLNVEANSSQLKGSFKVNLRMGYDSAVWLSITPALGIEAARVLITDDTLKYIDKVKNQYFKGDYSMLDSAFQYQTEYGFIENLLVGNPIEIEADEKYTSTTEDLYYVIQTKVKRKLKKAMDIPNKTTLDDTLYTDVVKEKKYQKATEKFEINDLIVKRYFVRASDFRIGKTYIDDLFYKRSIRIEYSNYQDVGGELLPHDIQVEIISPEESAKFDLNYTRVKLNEPQGYPFKIPSKFTPVR